MPAGMAGLTTYTDVNPNKIKLKPEYVVGIVAALVLAELVLYMSVVPI